MYLSVRALMCVPSVVCRLVDKYAVLYMSTCKRCLWFYEQLVRICRHEGKNPQVEEDTRERITSYNDMFPILSPLPSPPLLSPSPGLTSALWACSLARSYPSLRSPVSLLPPKTAL